MFDKIIVASSEISPAALDLLHCIRGLRRLGTRTCLILQVQPVFDIDEVTLTYLTAQLEKVLQTQKNYLVAQGFEVETKYIFGLTRTEINRIAEKEDYSLIVAGAAEHSLLGGVLYGGIAYELIHNSSKPVLLIRVTDLLERMPEKGEACSLLEHVLFPTDFSENAASAFGFLKKMVAGGVGKVTLMHVQDKSKIDPRSARAPGRVQRGGPQTADGTERIPAEGGSPVGRYPADIWFAIG